MVRSRSGFQEHVAGDPWANPRIHVAGTRALYVGQGMRLTPHKLAVATVIFALDAQFRLELIESGQTSIARFGLIPPDTLHHLKNNGRMAFLYLDALSDDYEGLDLAMLNHGNCDLEAFIDEIGHDNQSDAALLCDLLSNRIELPQKQVGDARIVAAVRAIDEVPQDFTNISQAAEIAKLSVSRFQHLFREAVGTPFRRYRLWKRMAIVARSLSNGENLTNAALDAGFSSSAHLSSSFRKMFGIMPSQLIEAKARFTGEVATN